MNVVLAGAGAIGRKHAAAIARIDGVELVSVVGRLEPDTKEFAAEFDIRHWTLDLGESLDLPGVDAVILATPTGMHAAQSIAAFEMGKHTLIEIPMADNLADSEAIVGAQERTGVVGMVAHTRRFNPSHQWVRARIESGEYAIQHFVVQTFFFRRENTNALGKPRSWTDHLLWHHACHTVDLFQYQTGEVVDRVSALQGPRHPEMGIAMDMTIGDQCERLDQLVAVAIASGAIGAAVAAEGLKIKLLWGSERRQAGQAMPAVDLLAMGKALMLNPKILLVDEPTAGLSPKFRREIFKVVQDINGAGVPILMVEQNAKQALSIANRGYVLVDGRNRLEDSGPGLLANREVAEMFLGGGTNGNSTGSGAGGSNGP